MPHRPSYQVRCTWFKRCVPRTQNEVPGKRLQVRPPILADVWHARPEYPVSVPSTRHLIQGTEYERGSAIGCRSLLALNRCLLSAVDSTNRCNTLDAIEAEGVLQMKQRPRISTPPTSQKALIWGRWQKGETLHQIAGLFERYHSSIQRIVAESGGIRPAERHRSRSALTLTEREEISRGVVAGRSIRAIAGSLGRGP